MIDVSPLPAKTYRELLTRLQWSQTQAARVLGISLRTSQAYATQGVPAGLASLALRLLLESQLNRGETDPLAPLERYCRRLETEIAQANKRTEQAEQKRYVANHAVREAYAAQLRDNAARAMKLLAAGLDKG